MNALHWLNPDVGTLQPYEPGRPIEEVARELGQDPASICKLASNENPLGPSPKALQQMHKVLGEMHRYPDGGAYCLRNAIAERFGVSRSQVVVGAGSNEILEFIGHCFMGPGKSVVVSGYAFVIYKLLAKMFGSAIIEVPATPGLGHDLDAMAAAIDENTSVVFLCNPNNPTGTLLEPAAIERFMASIPEHVLVVFDEAYAEIALGPMPDTLSYINRGRSCMMLRTFSKAYGLAGLRVGYGIGPQAIVEALQRPRQPFNVNRLAQEAAVAALADDDFVAESKQLFASGKAEIEAACKRLQLPFIASYANFMLIEVGNGAEISKQLTDAGIIIRPMAPYGLGQYIRVSFGTEQENHALIATLATIVSA